MSDIIKELDLGDRIHTRKFDDEGYDGLLQPDTLLVERYLIQGVIGVGGMGAVYSARDMHFPKAMKLVAVKEMINTAGDPIVRKTILRNFEREANILVSLAHPSIPKIFDYFNHNERSYLVLEYIKGKDLEALMKATQESFPEEQVVVWAIELCDVLSYLHHHEPECIVFRDMKPSNVMINQYNHVVLIDFGIAKNFQVGQKGTMIGTEGYAPPEQYRGEASPLADIYALGATLHHLLTNRDPRQEPPFTFLERPVRQINPLITPELEEVVNKALQYNPEDRFLTVLEMKDALVAAARKTGILTSIADPGNGNASVMEPDERLIWSFNCRDEIRGSPYCSRNIVYIGAYDHHIYALDAAQGQLIWQYQANGGIVSRPVVDADLVCFGSEDGLIYAITSRNGRLSWTYQTEAPVRCSPGVAEGHVFIGSDDGFLYAINLSLGRMAWRFDASAPIRSMPTISEKGYIYFGCDNGEVICVDLSGDAKWRFRSKRNVISSPLVDGDCVFFSSLDSMVYALDASSGWEKWRFRMGKGSISSPCIFDNHLYIGSADGNIYCIDAISGKEIWRFKTNHQVSGSPVYHNGAVYCGAADGNIYALEYRTGKQLWKFGTGGPITGTPWIDNEILFIGSVDHMLYALQL